MYKSNSSVHNTTEPPSLLDVICLSSVLLQCNGDLVFLKVNVLVLRFTAVALTSCAPDWKSKLLSVLLALFLYDSATLLVFST